MNIDIDGPVHYLEYEGVADGPPVVYVHGLGGSHLNWSALAPLLAPHVRAVAVDLPGFGRTPAAGRKTSVAANSRVLRRFLHTVVGEPAILVGNSMGGLLSIMATADEPALVRGLVLIDPALPLARGARLDASVGRHFIFHGLPYVGERVLARQYATVPARQRVSEVLQRCCKSADRIPPDMVDALAELEEELTGHRDHAASQLAAARSIVYCLARPWSCWRRMRAIQQPVLLLHGVHDRLVSIHSARQAAKRLPHWTFAELEAGHIPQMETPDLVAAEIVPWLARLSDPTSHRADDESGRAPDTVRTSTP